LGLGVRGGKKVLPIFFYLSILYSGYRVTEGQIKNWDKKGWVGRGISALRTGSNQSYPSF
jgi:hypothetical protein